MTQAERDEEAQAFTIRYETWRVKVSEIGNAIFNKDGTPDTIDDSKFFNGYKPQRIFQSK